MAASKMKNDFAPAWLKIPAQENTKPTPPKSGVDRAYERSFSEQSIGCGRLGAAYEDLHDVISTPRVPRQRSNSNRIDVTNGYRSAGSGCGQRTRTRPARSTRSYNQVNGANCEMANANPHGKPVSSRQLSDTFPDGSGTEAGGISRGRLREGNGRDQIRSKDHSNNISIDEEFPSLGGDTPNQLCGKPSYSKVASVWDGSVRESSNAAARAPITPESTAPRTLILKTSAVKRPVVDTEKRPVNSVVDGSSKLKTRNGCRELTTVLTAKVLTACLKQPKEASDRKSNFFKLMRRESHESTGIDGLNHAEPNRDLSSNKTTFMSIDTDSGLSVDVHSDHAEHSDGCNSIVQSPTTSISSPINEVVFSSEGELRLMQEMGWNEADYDGEDYEITDDDVREFQALCRRLQHEQLGCAKPRDDGFIRASGYVAKILSLGSGNKLSASSVDSDFSPDDSDASNS